MTDSENNPPAVINDTVAPVPSTNLEERMRQEMAVSQKGLGSMPANKINLGGKQFKLPDGQTTSDPISVIVLDYVWALVHYPGVWNPSNPSQPNCYALGREKPEGGELRPADDAAKQMNDNCGDCPRNQWKSAAVGNGKACKNQRRLIVVSPEFNNDTEVLSLYVSPMGLKFFDAYVSRLQNEHGLLPVQVITEICFDPDQTYPLLNFKFIEKHTQLNAAWALKEASQGVLFRPIETEDKTAPTT